MHTARQLRVEDFDIIVDGAPATRDDVLPSWTPWDRLGVIVDRPFGALGANAMIQLAITAFYDVRAERRSGFPTRFNPESELAVYPEIFMFHVGGRHGFYAAYDFWPARKEVFLPADPRKVLDAVNDRGITRLLVPDAPPRPVEHEYKEPAAARDRIVSAFAYAASGSAASADVEISSTRGAVQANANQVLAGAAQSGNLQAREAALDGRAVDADLMARHWNNHAAQRANEAHEHAEAARALRGALMRDGRVTEAYRRLSVNEALARLVGDRHE
jgi:hypothetical protein